MERLSTIGYINAGGRGTRLNGLFIPDPQTGIAKALLEIGNPSIRLVDHHISNFRFQNINEVTVAVGDQVEAYEYLKDSYSDDKLLHVTKSQDQIGTGGDLISYARTLCADRDIIIQNVDTILDIDLDALSNDFRVAAKMGVVACIALTTNRGVPNEGAFAVGANNMVVFSDEFSNEPTPDTLDPVHYRASSTGAVAVTAHFLRSQKWDKSHGQNSLYKDLLHDAWSQGKLSAYNNRDGFFRDVGTVDSWLMSQDDPLIQGNLRYNK